MEREEEHQEFSDREKSQKKKGLEKGGRSSQNL